MRGFRHLPSGVRNRLRKEHMDANLERSQSETDWAEVRRWRSMSKAQREAESRRLFEEAMERANTEAPKGGDA